MLSLRHSLVLFGSTLAAGLAAWILLAGQQTTSSRSPLLLPLAEADSMLEFYGVSLPGSDFVWCIDRSCSMSWNGDLATLKQEVAAALDQLAPTSRFSIVSFSDDVTTWSPDLQFATSSAVDAGTAFVNALSSGGNGCVVDGLAAAIEIAEQSSDVSIVLAGDSPEETCPPFGSVTDAQALAEVIALNPSSIPIHCFNTVSDTGPVSAAPFFELLSDEFGGAFFDLLDPSTAIIPELPRFVRGDANLDGTVDISDAVFGLAVLFLGEDPDCLDAIDTNDDGVVDISDAVYALQSLFSPTGTPPPAPYPACGVDPTCDPLTCDFYSGSCPASGFMPAVTVLTTPSNPLDATPGDFDGNGVIDLAVCGTEFVQLYISSGGSLLPGQVISTPTVNEAMVSGDFNGDGVIDLAVVGNLAGATVASLHIILSNGDGTGSLSTSPIPGGATQVDAADLNGDGALDLVTGSIDEASVTVRLGNGDGTFTAGPTFTGLGDPVRATFCNVNNDGNVDLVVLDTATNVAFIFLGDGLGDFASPIVRTFSPLGVLGLAIDDFTGNGANDLFTYFVGTGALSLYQGSGTGGFSFTSQLSAPPGTTHLAGADFNLDGIADLAVARDLSMDVYLSTGSGDFSSPQVVEPAGATNLAFLRAFDADGDGDFDLVTGLNNGAIQISRNVLIP